MGCVGCQITMSELKQRIAGMSLERRALLEQRLLRSLGGNRQQRMIPRQNPGDPTRLSFGQQQMWFLDQLTPGTSTYNIPDAFRVRGALDVVALEKALDLIIRRHEVLRTNFLSVDGNPVSVVAQDWKIQIAQFDVRSLPPEARAAEGNRVALAQVRQAFDITRDLMFRAAVIRIEEDEWILLFLSHHIAWDIASKGVLYRELTSLYKSFVTGTRVELPDLPIQYSDFAAWQHQRLEGEVLEEQTAYWRKQLGDAAHVLDLPTDHPRRADKTFRGAKQFFSLPSALVETARGLSREQNTTLFMTLLAAFVAYLNGFTGQNDISIGSPMDGRNYPELEGLIGFFINTTVLRFEISPTTTYRELMQQARKVTLGAHAHSDLPFKKLVEIIRPQRDPTRMALIQVNFRARTQELPKLELPGLKIEPIFELIDTGTAKFDLAIELATDGSGESFCEYNTGLFEPSTVARVTSDFEQLLREVLQHPDIPLKSLKTFGQLARRKGPMENVAEKPKMKSLKDFKRKAVDLSQPTVNTSQLRPDQKLPLIVTPAVANMDLAEWAANNRDFISEKVLEHGAVLFRRFNLPTPSDFERAAASICKELYSEYGDLPREGVAGKIYKSTPYPADKMILYHNESSHLSSWPTRINFFCALPAQEGGATPVADCREIAKVMDPEILRTFEEKGLKYVRNFSPGLDVSWQQFFHTNDRAVVEKQCAEAGMTCEWTANDGLRVGQLCQAVTRHPKTGEKIFFNQVQLHHVYCLDKETRESMLKIFKREDLPRHVYYGDGTEIPDSVMEHVGEVYEKCAVRFQWEKGDMISVDNMMVCHARDPHVGDRKICVAMGPLISAKEAAAMAAAFKN
jgi:hypothetical protein